MPSPDESMPEEQADLAAESESCLRRSPLLLECHIQCEFDNGVLTLRGRVPNYSSKHVAQALAKRIAGVSGVSNRLEVMPIPVAQEESDGELLPPVAG